MRCKNVIRELCDYLDGQLDKTVLADLEHHLENCEDCRLVVDTTKKTVQIFCNSEPVPIPEETRSRLHQALFSRLRKPRS